MCELFDAFARAVKEHNVPELATAKPRFKNAFAALEKGDFPPSYMERMADHCASVAYFKETGCSADGDEPFWHKMIGLSKHAEDGEEKAHEWSANYAGYSAAETQQKLEAWTYGPPMCATIKATDRGKHTCATCKQECSTPMQLGYSEHLPPPVSPEEPVAPAAEAPVAQKEADIPHWPSDRYTWDGQHMRAAIKGDDGVVHHLKFGSDFFYLIDRCKEDSKDTRDAGRAVEIRARIGGVWKEFTVPTKVLTDPASLATELAKNEIIASTQEAKRLQQQYVNDYLSSLKRGSVETNRYEQFGWQPGGEFVIGPKAVSHQGVKPAKLFSKVSSNKEFMEGMHRTKGTSAGWAQIVNEVYNRPGMEFHQFQICAAFGAPLIGLLNLDNWHGVPIAMTGKGSTGKSTIHKVCASIFVGDKRAMMVSAMNEGTTITAIFSKLGILKNLPMILDEITGREAVEYRGLVYCFANGQSKGRANPDGSLQPGVRWDTTLFINGNDDIIPSLTAELPKNVGEATSLRVLELPMTEYHAKLLSKHPEHYTMVEHDLLMNHYGVVGEEYIRYVIPRVNAIQQRYLQLRAKYSPNSEDETKERYYRDGILTAMLGGVLAKKLGFIAFDLDYLRDFMFDHIKIMRKDRNDKSYTTDDYVASFLSHVQDKILVTKRFGGKDTEVPIKEPTRGLAARMALDDRRFIVSVKAFNEWCSERKLAPNELRKDMALEGYFVETKDGRSGQGAEYLGRGTHVAAGKCRTMELQYNKVVRHLQDEGQSGKVIELHQKDSPVTQLVADSESKTA